MRVLYVLRYYPTLTENFVYREIAELGQRGVEVEIVALGMRADGALQDQMPDVPVHRPPRGWDAWRLAMGLPYVLDSMGRWLSRRMRWKDVFRAAWLARKSAGFDRLHVHFAGEAAEWARASAAWSGVPYSVTVHAVDLYRPRGGMSVVVNDASPVVTVCEANQIEIARRYGVLAQVVRCGVSTEVPLAKVDAPGPLQVIAVARDVPKKGLEVLVRAVRECSQPIELTLVSDAMRLAGPSTTVAQLSPSAVPDALARAQVFALPCRVSDDGDRDGVPVAMMEAMAAGLPIITTAVSGIGELVDETVGWLVEPDAPKELARVLSEVASDPIQRLRRGTAGRRRIAAEWTVARQVDGLMNAWSMGD